MGVDLHIEGMAEAGDRYAQSVSWTDVSLWTGRGRKSFISSKMVSERGRARLC